MKCKVKAETCVNPTEDINKVIKALYNVFGEYEEIKVVGDSVVILGKCFILNYLKEFMEKKKIRDTAREIFLQGVENNMIKFKLSKQAAFTGNINLVEKNLSPLGEIDVEIKTKDPTRLIEWLCMH